MAGRSTSVGPSHIHVHSVEDHVPTEWAVLLVDGLPQQDVCTVSTQAEVPAGQQHHRLGTVLTDHTLLPVLLLLQQSQQILSR